MVNVPPAIFAVAILLVLLFILTNVKFTVLVEGIEKTLLTAKELLSGLSVTEVPVVL
jgi:hypothetical protein